MNHTGMRIIGHRGSAELAPENTVHAITAAIAAGVDGVEFDVRVTSDGIPVLAHDKVIVHNGRSLLISAHTYTVLQAAKPNLATLQEAMESINGQVIPMIEVKPAEPIEPIVKVIRKLLATTYQPDGMQLGSKSHKTLCALHAVLPDVPKVVIESWSGVLATWRARRVGTKHLYMRSWWLWSGFLRTMQRRGYMVSAYTINNPAGALRWQKYLYGVITDYPTRFLADHANTPGRDS